MAINYLKVNPSYCQACHPARFSARNGGLHPIIDVPLAVEFTWLEHSHPGNLTPTRFWECKPASLWGI
jgi:hypothetical protein